MKYKPCIGTLGFVVNSSITETLLVHRIARSSDDHLGKYNGLGGKMMKNESIHECMKRELQEESGIIATTMHLKGSINWTDFGPKNEDWLCFIFLITDYTGIVQKNSPEGPLKFHKINSLHTLPMWKGDKHFLPLIFNVDAPPFHGYMPYENNEPKEWRYSF